MSTLTLQPAPARSTCPAWCTVAPFPGGHVNHHGTAADWEGPGRVLGEVGIVHRAGSAVQVTVEIEQYDDHGRTTARHVMALTPEQTKAMGELLFAYGDAQLCGALLEATRLLDGRKEA